LTILGKLDTGKKFGSIEERHVYVEDLTGPAADLALAIDAEGDIVFNIASESPRDIQYAGVESITGLPAGIYVVSITFDKTAKTLTVRVVNKTGAAATITANTVTVRVVSVS